MDEQTTFFYRIGGWFSKSNRTGNGAAGNGADQGELPLEQHAANMPVVVTRSSFLRPWAKRDAAIQQLQDGFHALTDLMGGIRDNLDRQDRRQAELMQYLSSLPQVLEQLPESSRVQGEALQAINQQLASQNAQQQKLADILQRIGETGGQQRELIEDLAKRVDSAKHNDETIAAHLQSVGEAMQEISRTSSDSTHVLQNPPRQHRHPRWPARTHSAQAEHALHNDACNRDLFVDLAAGGGVHRGVFAGGEEVIGKP